MDLQLVASLVDDSAWGRSQAVKDIDINQRIGHLRASISLFTCLIISDIWFPGNGGPVTMVSVAWMQEPSSSKWQMQVCVCVCVCACVPHICGCACVNVHLGSKHLRQWNGMCFGFAVTWPNSGAAT